MRRDRSNQLILVSINRRERCSGAAHSQRAPLLMGPFSLGFVLLSLQRSITTRDVSDGFCVSSGNVHPGMYFNPHLSVSQQPQNLHVSSSSNLITDVLCFADSSDA